MHDEAADAAVVLVAPLAVAVALVRLEDSVLANMSHRVRPCAARLFHDISIFVVDWERSLACLVPVTSIVFAPYLDCACSLVLHYVAHLAGFSFSLIVRLLVRAEQDWHSLPLLSDLNNKVELLFAILMLVLGHLFGRIEVLACAQPVTFGVLIRDH